MKNILNEKLYVDKLLNGEVRKNNIYNDWKILAKYFANEFKNEENTEQSIEGNIIKYCEKYYTDYDSDIRLPKIKKIVKYYGKQELYVAPNINITNHEMDKIKALKMQGQEKLAFMLLVLAKIKGAAYNGKYYFLDNEWDLWKFAGLINLTKDKRNNLLNQLEDNKLIKQRRLHDKSGTLSIEILFVDKEESDIELTVDDYTYPQYIYLKYLGKPFIKCEKCGIETPKNSNSHKCCKFCSAKAKKESVKECMRKIRKKECDKIENNKKAI